MTTVPTGFYGKHYPETDQWADRDGTVHGTETNTSDSPVLENSRPSTRQNNGSNGSNEHAKLLAGVRNGTWLDQQSFPPLVYAVDGLIPEGFSLLIGPPKAGKSWLLGGLLLAVASGGYALGKIPLSTKRPVFYLALEDGDRRMQARARKILGDSEPIPELFHYITKIEPGQVFATIEAFLTIHPDTALVVLDTLGKVMPNAGMGESPYQRDYRIGSRLKQITDGHQGLAIVVVHHDRKASAEDFVDSVNATNGLAGSADTIMVLDRKRQSSDGLLKVTGRDVPEAEYALQMIDGHWTLDGANLADAAATARRRAETIELGDTSNGIIAFVAQHPEGVAAKEIRDRFGAGADTYLKRLVDSDRLVKVKRGVYAAPDPIQTTASEPLELLEQQVNAPTETNNVAQPVLEMAGTSNDSNGSNGDRDQTADVKNEPPSRCDSCARPMPLTQTPDGAWLCRDCKPDHALKADTGRCCKDSALTPACKLCDFSPTSWRKPA
ncbi:AAA family ATPase [Amycolatopsis dongchuanensis]|uniref:AAA domain-containing protein n=1 Tax=Amycolatopsis dongchuanensis TaxID=1070866 RepID=A0ABP8VJ46_9PSEU